MSTASPADGGSSVHYTTIEYSAIHHVATIRLNRPDAMNAINEPMRNEIADAMYRAIADGEVRVIVIGANGRGFSAGTDLESDRHIDTYDLLDQQYKQLLTLVYQCPKPVIAAVQGGCVGVGASLALACDLVVMGEQAFMYLAFANVGLVPDGGLCWHLVRNIGYKRAFQMIAEAGRIGARECLDYGLVNKLVPEEKLAEEAQRWAERLSQAALLTLKLSKQALQQAMRVDLFDTMRLEASFQAICCESEDYREGMTAFFEKRKPVFKGK